ncbi:MAG: hypothetical protein NC231_05765 [Bacillus sp. (in: Bacteria)]|nr:hypothetical protein [Bacillus sp. (in: firmicutes)]
MGMQIGTVSTKGNTTYITLKNKDGSTMGTLAVTKATRAKTKKKKLTYNFKKVSNRIMASKTSSHANKAVREARGELVQLLMKQKSGDYDEKAVSDAITHARAIERVAKKHRKHIEEEERAKQTNSGMTEETEEEEETLEEEEVEETEQAQQQAQAQQQQQQAERAAREMEQLAQEIEQMLRESEEAMNELADELMSSASCEHMDDDDIEQMKKRHRSEELRDIMEADMKYLKALFDRLAKEKQANASGADSYSSSDSANTNSSYPISGVSLEIAGVDVPVETAAAPVPAEGGCVDVSL